MTWLHWRPWDLQKSSAYRQQQGQIAIEIRAFTPQKWQHSNIQPSGQGVMAIAKISLELQLAILAFSDHEGKVLPSYSIYAECVIRRRLADQPASVEDSMKDWWLMPYDWHWKIMMTYSSWGLYVNLRPRAHIVANGWFTVIIIWICIGIYIYIYTNV